MDIRTAIEKALRFEEVRPVPYTVWYDAKTEKKLDAHYGGTSWKGKIGNSLERYLILWEPAEALEADTYRDAHGTIWKKGNPVHILKPALAEPNLRGYDVPDYTALLHGGGPEHINHSHGIIPSFTYGEFASRFAGNTRGPLEIAGYGPGIFERGWMIRGYEDFMTDLVTEPSFVEELLDMITDRQVSFLKELCRLPVDGILFAGRLGRPAGGNHRTGTLA